MTPDEYEARLRDAVFCPRDAAPCRTPHDHQGDWFGDDLDAYADWLRLRVVAESMSTDIEDAKRRMAELLAAAEVTESANE